MTDHPGVSYGRKPRTDGRWQGYLLLAGGKRRTVIRRTEAEMRAELDRLAAARDQGREPEPTDPTLVAYLVRWIGQRRDGTIGTRKLAPATVLRYEQLVRLQIAPHVGASFRLSRVRAGHVDQLMEALDRAGCSGTIRLQVYRLLSVALKHARRRLLIDQNPCELVDPPAREATPSRSLDTADVVAVLRAAQGHPHEALLWTAIGTGCRQGELFALRIADLDLDAAAVSIREKVQWLPGRGSVRSAPKTAAGVRTMALPAAVVAMLRKHLAAQQQAGRPNPLGLVFPSQAGTHLQPSNWNKNVWAAWKKAAGIDPATPFRALTRKAHASLLVALGVDRETLRHRAGHTSSQTTDDYYVLAVGEADRAAARKLDAELRRLLSPAPKRKGRPRRSG